MHWRYLERDEGTEVLAAEDLIEEASYEVNVLIADLHEHGTGVSE